jgi:GTP-binding protein LepA
MDIIQERLEREYGVEILATAPNTVYQIVKTNGETIIIDNPSKLPGGSQVDKILEPIIEGTIIIPSQYVGNVLKLCQSKRGIQKQLKYISETKVIIVYELPLPEILLDFYDRLKTISQGYASFDYEFIGYHESNLCKLDILVNGEIIDALSIITHKENAYHRGRELADKLRKIIPRQLFEVAIQAAIGNRVIARESVKALRKNVTAKCYGGDITIKRKLLEKQREGKKRMKKVGRIEIPQEAFLSVLKVDDTK